MPSVAFKMNLLEVELIYGPKIYNVNRNFIMNQIFEGVFEIIRILHV